MKCPYCKEEIERNCIVCSVCGEKIPKLYGLTDYLKEVFSTDKVKKVIKKSAIIVSILVAIIVIVLSLVGIIRYTMNEIESNKFTDNGYKSVIRHDDYTYASRYNTDFELMTDKVIELLKEISKEENDLMTFFKKSKSKNDNAKLFSIFMTNCDKFKEDAEMIYNNSKTTFQSLGIKLSKPIENNQYELISIIKPTIKSFYFITENSDYVFFRYDYKYMLDTYAPYLTDDWKEFFELEIETGIAFMGIDYEDPAYARNARIIGKKWLQFIEKYPEFLYSEEMGEYAYELSSY